MLTAIDNDKALSYVSKYFTLVSRTGYAKHNIVQWYLFYLFIIDFVNWVYPYFTDDDYKKVDMAIVKLFSGGNCLVPYQVFSYDKLKIARHVGLAHYTGPSILRKTEPVGYTRTTEDETLRIQG